MRYLVRLNGAPFVVVDAHRRLEHPEAVAYEWNTYREVPSGVTVRPVADADREQWSVTP